MTKRPFWRRALAATLLFALGRAAIARADITFDNATKANSGGSTQVNSLTFSHTVSSGGANRLLIVGVALRGNNTVTVTYGAASMTSVRSAIFSNHLKVEIFRLLAPATGANDVVIQVSGSNTDRIAAGAVSLTGVNQTDPIGAAADSNGSSSTASATVNGVNDGELVIDAVNTHGWASGESLP